MTVLTRTFQQWWSSKPVTIGWKVLRYILLPFYLSRVTAEFLLPSASPFVGGLLGLMVGVLLTLWIERRPTAQRWPVIWLLPYVVYPWQNPSLAATSAIIMLCSVITPRVKRASILFEAAIFIATLGLYIFTTAKGVQPADAGEFQYVIANWGVAHPPGYPLYTLLGGIFARILPLGTIAFRVNLFSALIGAMTVTIFANAVRRYTSSLWSALLTAGTLAIATSFWTTSTQASIRPMTALFVVLMVEATLSYHASVAGNDPKAARWDLLRFGLAAGFGVTHHASVLFVGIVLALAIIVTKPDLIVKPRRWLPVIGVALLGALPWLYLIIRGAANAPLAPPNLATWDGFWQHALAAGFAGDMFYYLAFPELGERLVMVGQILTFQWHGLILLLAGGGFFVMLFNARWLAFTTGTAFMVHTLVAASYRAPQTVEYMIPAYVMLAIMVGWAIHTGITALQKHKVEGAVVGIAISVLLISGGPVWTSLHAYQDRDTTTINAEALLNAAEPGSVILANWHHTTPLWVLQTAEQLGEDVEVRYVAPQGAEPIIETWSRLLVEESVNQPTMTCANYPEAFRQTGLSFSAIESCWQTSAQTVSEVSTFEMVDFGDVQLNEAAFAEQVTIGEPAAIDLSWQIPEAAPYGTYTSFVHLVRDDGWVLAQTDQPLNAAGLSEAGTIRQRLDLWLPRTIPAGAYQIMVGIYRTDGSETTFLTDPDRHDRIPVGVIAVQHSAIPPVTLNPQYTPIGEALKLIGYDFDFSAAGRARLVLHWHIHPQEAQTPITVTVNGQRNPLGQGVIPLTSKGYLTTAIDVPDIEAAQGLRLTFTQNSNAIRANGLWNIAFREAVHLPPATTPTQYIMVGDMVLTDVSTEHFTDGTSSVHLTLHGTNAVLQDMNIQFAAANGTQVNLPPTNGMIPTLKWQWHSIIHDTFRLDIDANTIVFYDAFTSAPWPVFDPVLNRNHTALQLPQ